MFRRMITRHRLQAVLAVAMLATVILVGWGDNAWQPRPSSGPAGALAPAGEGIGPSGASINSAVQAPGSSPLVLQGAQVGVEIKHDLSAPLASIPPVPPSGATHQEKENPPLPVSNLTNQPDPVIQRTVGPTLMPATTANFPGINATGSGCGCAPPDTNGAPGQTQYVQIVNTAFQVFSKTGTSLYGPANINTVWSGFGGTCQTSNDGDPVLLYDKMANRWLISQFTATSPYDECIAISQTSDATGAWYRYAFQLSTTDFMDYPKIGIWPDGYYMTVNDFAGGATYQGPKPYVFNRSAMLSGQTATFQTFAALGGTHNSQLPSDLDGNTQPPSGSPNFFVEFGNPVKFYKFHVDWTTPANSTFTNYANVSVAGFTQLCSSTQNCIPQPISQKLDGLGDRLMFRAAYRNFGDHESLVVNHSASTGTGNPPSGVRWYEFRGLSSTPTVYQQSTYAPDSNSRWMGSVAMDSAGNMAVGYSVSSSSVYPSIRLAGRLVTDPLNTLGQSESTILAGTGGQSGVNRWGDYSSMTIDPTDDCTFWYTQEYNNSGGWNWSTQIVSFKYSNCGGSSPTPTSTTAPSSTPTKTNTPPPGPTNTPTPTKTNTPTPTKTNTPPPGPTNTPTRTNTPTPTKTNTSTPTKTSTPTSGGNVIVNGGFESGPGVGWGEYSSGGYEIITTNWPHTGSWSAWECGYNYCTEYIYQTVTVPTNGTLTYWWYMTSSEGTGYPYDYMNVQLYNTNGTLLTTLRTWSNTSTRNLWSQDSISLSSYAGQTLQLRFTTTTDYSLSTSFYIDDVSLQ